MKKIDEGEKEDDVTADDIVKNDQPENHGTKTDERNAVLKKVVTDKAGFKPLFLGGFKDIKFNFFNNYPSPTGGGSFESSLYPGRWFRDQSGNKDPEGYCSQF